MRKLWIVAMCVVVFAAAGLWAHLGWHRAKGAGALLHVRNTFEFVMDAPMQTVFSLFGAERERVWAPGWEPEFVYPSPASDVVGAVFVVKHGHGKATWINTVFDTANGHVQYVYVLPDVMVTLIDIHLTQLSPEQTQAAVVYERTALSADANAAVAQHGEADSKMGPEWAEQINAYLRTSKR